MRPPFACVIVSVTSSHRRRSYPRFFFSLQKPAARYVALCSRDSLAAAFFSRSGFIKTRKRTRLAIRDATLTDLAAELRAGDVTPGTLEPTISMMIGDSSTAGYPAVPGGLADGNPA